MTGEPLRVEHSPKRVRALAGGSVVADSVRALLVWEHDFYPTYYFPPDDLRVPLEPSGRAVDGPHPGLGRGELQDLGTPGGPLRRAAIRYPAAVVPEVGRSVRLQWSSMDEWLEEDEPVYVHPRSPYVRVDILASSRHVRVALDGTTLAESSQPRILFETGLPPRYYLPLTAYDLSLLRPSPTVTHCPYKGTAGYFHVEVEGRLHRDLLWCYRTPLPESQKVAGLVAPYNEKVDLAIDGVPVERPVTHFS